MGWSATAAACHELDRWEDATRVADPDGPSNGWLWRGDRYFWEIGPELADGAIQGDAYRRVSDGLADRVGGWRIEPNGCVHQWPVGLRGLVVAL